MLELLQLQGFKMIIYTDVQDLLHQLKWAVIDFKLIICQLQNYHCVIRLDAHGFSLISD